LIKLKDAKGFPPPVGDLADLGRDTFFLRTGIGFQALTRVSQWYQYAPTVDLVQGLTDPANEPEKSDIAVFLHNRILRPFLGLALLCLCLPQVLGGYGRNMFVNLGTSLGTSAVFYGACFMAQYLGSHAVISPELSAWSPLIGFGTIAAARWDAIRS
jgi:lipopolysaccharide export system permease protein